MKKFKLILKAVPFALLLLISVASGPVASDLSVARYKNVCKDLKNDVLLYFVFIDTRTTYPWTEFDIISTIDSLNTAVKWIEQQARKNNVELHIKTDYYIGNEFATVERNLPNKTVKETIETSGYKKGVDALNRWGDYVAKTIGESLYMKEKDGIPIQKKPNTKERLIAYLRDDAGVESVSLMFMVNNYFRNDISLAVNTFDTDDVEFCIVSYKYPSEIAHNLLHLFGAVDLYKSEVRKSNNKIKLAEKFFPKDIMQDPYARDLKQLEIGEFTRYMIGWTDDLPDEYKPLLTDRIL